MLRKTCLDLAMHDKLAHWCGLGSLERATAITSRQSSSLCKISFFLMLPSVEPSPVLQQTSDVFFEIG